MKLWIIGLVLVVISIILIFLYSLVAVSSESERIIEQIMEREGRNDTDEQGMEAIVMERKERHLIRQKLSILHSLQMRMEI